VQHCHQLAANGCKQLTIEERDRQTDRETDGQMYEHELDFKCIYLLKSRKQFIIAIAVDVVAVVVAHKQTRVKYSIKSS